MAEFVKRSPSAPSGFFAAEAAGLRWLGSVDGGVPCAQVLSADASSLTLRRLQPVPPSAQAARTFGARLAVTHDAGATAFGAGPDGHTGPGFFGPLSNPLPMSLTPHLAWGAFYSAERLQPMAETAAARLEPDVRAVVEAVIRRCAAGHFDDGDRASRLHGDLWSGNVMWTSGGAVLIDPAAHGGHRETDLAMLALFGCPYLREVIDGYQAVHRLRARWQDRRGLHQLYPLLAHVVLFGAGYASQVGRAARHALAA